MLSTVHLENMHGAHKRGSKVEFFDKRSVAYMVVRAACYSLQSTKEHDMYEDKQRSFTTNKIQFSSQHQDRYNKKKHRGRKTARTRQKRRNVQHTYDSSTPRKRYGPQSFN